MSTEHFGISGRVDARLYDNDDLLDEYPEWHSMTNSEKIEAARDVTPVEERHESNVTTHGMHAYFVRNLSGNRNAAPDNVTAEWIALGTNAGAGTSPGDEDLNDRVIESRVSDWGEDQSNMELRVSSIIGGNELGDEILNELGLFSGDPTALHRDESFMLNHATFEDLQAEGETSLTFDVTLKFTNV